MFTAVLLTIAKTWKQPKCPLTDEWIKQMCYIYTLEYSPAMKKNNMMPFATTSMEQETLMLSEVKSEKDKYHMIAPLSGIQFMAQMKLSTEKKLTDLENKLAIAGVGVEEGVGWTGRLGLIDANYCI